MCPKVSGGFRPGPGAQAPQLLCPQFCSSRPIFIPRMIFAAITQTSDFLAFPNFTKGQICGFHQTSKNKKVLQLQGAKPPPLTP